MQEINWSQDSLLRKDSQDETFSVNTLTEENVGRAVESLPDDKKKLIFDIVEKVDIADSQSSIHYGAGAQSNISDFSNQILHQVQAKDSGYIGELVIDLSNTVNEIDVGSLASLNPAKKPGFLSKASGSLKKFLTRYQKLDSKIDSISAQLDSAQIALLKDLTMLDTLYDKNLDYIGQLDMYIIAGVAKLSQVKTTVLPAAKVKAEQTGDPMDVQTYQDITNWIERFSQKVYDLKLSRTIAIQTAPQIRMIQNNDRLLIDKIQTSILNTIPLWKSQIVIAIGLFRQKDALEMQKKVTQTTNELLLRNAQMLKLNTVETARESQRGIVELETLREVNENLMDTIHDVMQIQEEGRQKRKAAETELVEIESKLKERLMGIQH